MTGISIGQRNRRWRCARTVNALALCFGIAAFGAGETRGAVQTSLDLVCDTQSAQPIRFRFELQQKKWCFAQCQSVWTIDELGDGMIKLSVRSKDGSDYWTINIDRYTTKWWEVHSGHGSAPADWGQCKIEPFSGFPQKKF